MNAHPFHVRWLALVVAVLALALPGSSGAQGTPLKILLTNDDGFDSSGLKVMRAALVAAGHQITVRSRCSTAT